MIGARLDTTPLLRALRERAERLVRRRRSKGGGWRDPRALWPDWFEGTR